MTDRSCLSQEGLCVYKINGTVEWRPHLDIHSRMMPESLMGRWQQCLDKESGECEYRLTHV